MEKRRTYIGIHLWFFILLGSLFIFSITIPNTYSYFTATVQTQTNTLKADGINNYLIIAPGKAKAALPAVGIPSAEIRPAAYTDQNGLLTLDLGEVVEGNSRNFDDLLQLNNISTKALNLSWQMEGPIAPLIETIPPNIILLPGGSPKTSDLSNKTNPYSFGLKLKVKVPPGQYTGNLVIKANGNFLLTKIPAKITVRKGGY